MAEVINLGSYTFYSKGRYNKESDGEYKNWEANRTWETSERIKRLGLKPGQKITVSYGGGYKLRNYTGTINRIWFPDKPACYSSGCATIFLQQNVKERLLESCYIETITIHE